VQLLFCRHLPNPKRLCANLAHLSGDAVPLSSCDSIYFSFHNMHIMLNSRAGQTQALGSFCVTLLALSRVLLPKNVKTNTKGILGTLLQILHILPLSFPIPFSFIFCESKTPLLISDNQTEISPN
jgi:hypothetical protein